MSPVFQRYQLVPYSPTSIRKSIGESYGVIQDLGRMGLRCRC